jgi:hypothetical protein
MDRTGLGAAIAFCLLAAMAVVGGCSPTPSATDRRPGTAPPVEPTPVAGSGSILQTAWGPIWDVIPPEFLLFAGAQPVEIDEPVSAALDHPAEAASPSDIANGYVTDLAVGGWQTAVDGPLEDGSVVVDAAREGTTCRAQVRATPLGGFVRITILYGADCPKP